jgi:hypothetical protein
LEDQRIEHALRQPYDRMLLVQEILEKVVQNQNAIAAAERQGHQELRDAQRTEELKARWQAFELQKLDVKSDLLAGFATLAREIGQAQAAVLLAQLQAQEQEQLASAATHQAAARQKISEAAGKSQETKGAKADISPALQAERELSETIRRDEEAFSARIALLKARMDHGTATHFEVREYHALLSQLAAAEKKNRAMKGHEGDRLSAAEKDNLREQRRELTSRDHYGEGRLELGGGAVRRRTFHR